MRLVGAHVAVSRGLVRGGLARAEALGAEGVQIFAGNPRSWAAPADDPSGDEIFRALCAERRLPVFVHAPYLINFGSPSPDTLARSAHSLAYVLRRACLIGARGVVLHAGSAVLGNRWDDAMAQVRSSLLPVLDAAPAVPLLIEPTAGGGGALASDLSSLDAYLNALGRDERIGICLDTCHLHAAGHDLSTEASMRRVLNAAARLGKIGLIHANDSRDPAGSRRDRHASIGGGTIGLAPFHALFTTRALRNVPIVVETEEADHAADIAALKKLRDAR